MRAGSVRPEPCWNELRGCLLHVPLRPVRAAAADPSTFSKASSLLWRVTAGLRQVGAMPIASPSSPATAKDGLGSGRHRWAGQWLALKSCTTTGSPICDTIGLSKARPLNLTQPIFDEPVKENDE